MNRLGNAIKEIRKLVPNNYIEISEVFRLHTSGDTEHKFIGVTFTKVCGDEITIIRNDLETLLHDMSNAIIEHEAKRTTPSIESNKDGI